MALTNGKDAGIAQVSLGMDMGAPLAGHGVRRAHVGKERLFPLSPPLHSCHRHVSLPHGR